LLHLILLKTRRVNCTRATAATKCEVSTSLHQLLGDCDINLCL